MPDFCSVFPGFKSRKNSRTGCSTRSEITAYAELAEAYTELQAAQVQIIEKERLESELQVASEIQESILPQTLPVIPGIDLGVMMRPARAVGGDLYDLIALKENCLGVVIGDVSDKGVPAAIFMALARSLLRAEASRMAPPAAVLREVNRHLTTTFSVSSCRQSSQIA